jgi:hypothetical protein
MNAMTDAPDPDRWTWFGPTPDQESRWFWRFDWLRDARDRFGLGVILAFALGGWYGLAIGQWWPVVATPGVVVWGWPLARMFRAHRHRGRARAQDN